MKRWRKIVIFTMILALPISIWASVSMASHCQSSDDTSHSMQMNDGDMHAHMHDQISSQNSNNNSNCVCGCDGGQDCSVSGCSVSVLSNTTGINPLYTSQSVYPSVKALAILVDSSCLFRPPISLS